jgi:hypothetical protein
LGKVLTMTTYRFGSYLLSEESRKHYADPALELMTLDFDFIGWLIGSPASVSATAVELAPGVPGEISGILNYDSGDRKAGARTSAGTPALENRIPVLCGPPAVTKKEKSAQSASARPTA